MQKLLDEILGLGREAIALGQATANRLRIDPSELPAGFYNTALLKVNMNLEVINWYAKDWLRRAALPPGCDRDAEWDENVQLVLMIVRMGFIEVLSALEFSAKFVVAARPAVFGPFSGRVYLSTIMKRSVDRQLISSSVHTLWQGAIRFRNAIVHNNGVASETGVYDYPGITLTLRSEEMTRGPVTMFPRIETWLLRAYHDWLLAVYR